MTTHPDDITLAARAMTDIEPPTDLEARITRRLDAQTQTRPTTSRWPILAGFATAAVTVIIAVTVRSPEVPESRGPEVRGEVPGARGPAVPQPLPRLGSDAGPRDLGTSGLRNPAVNRGTPGPRDLGTSIRPSETELAWMSRRVSPLEVIDPLQLERLHVNSIQPDTLSITPLTITPLVTAPAIGDPDTGRQH